MILTRYLYQKHNVIYSLYVSLALADLQQSLFWAYELYYSGFRTETVELLLDIYTNYYAIEPIKPSFQKWLTKIVEQWRQDMKPEIVATIVGNMIRREPDAEKFREKIPDLVFPVPPTYIQKPVFVISKQAPTQYYTKLAEYSKGWKLPRIACQYVSYSDPMERPIKLADYVDDNQWLYSSAGSPIWRTRIKKYGGKVDESTQSVKFLSEDTEEEFMNWFSMEPDEQPMDIQAAWFGEPL